MAVKGPKEKAQRARFKESWLKMWLKDDDENHYTLAVFRWRYQIN